MLAGILLAGKGDRVAMRSSVETRYPFLDEDVIGVHGRLHPRWKLRGLRDKYSRGRWPSAGCRSDRLAGRRCSGADGLFPPQVC